MGVIVQVRDLDLAVQERLRKSAAMEGLSLSAFLRRELTELARDLEVQERAGYGTTLQAMLGGPLPGLENVSIQDIVDVIHEERGSAE
ncbi:MAG: hypothetical protein ABI238_05520 [Terrimesophilobacter sp.]